MAVCHRGVPWGAQQKASSCENSCTCWHIAYCWTRTVRWARYPARHQNHSVHRRKITHEESERRLAAGNVYIFGLTERYSIDGDTSKNTAHFMNHSCETNCHTEQFSNTIWIVAIRDIVAGEELTYNYEYEIDNEPPEPCHCGAKNC